MKPIQTLKWIPETANLLLYISNPAIPEYVSDFAIKNGYVLKSEFHISIIANQNGKKIMEICGSDSEILSRIETLSREYSWEVDYLDKFFEIEKEYEATESVPLHIRKSIIQKVTTSELADFYEKLCEITGIEFELPFAHMTLYAWSNYEPIMKTGIGLYSEDDFRSFLKSSL